MRAEATTASPRDSGADTACVGVFEDEAIAHDLDGGALQALVDSGEARGSFKHLALAHGDGVRWLLVGLGKRDDFDSERARVAAAVAVGRARELGATQLCWELPHHVDDAVAQALVEGTALAEYRFEGFRAPDEPERPRLERLVVSSHHDVAAAVALGDVCARAANVARELQNLPPNELTPTALGERAVALAAQHESLSVAVDGRSEIVARGMGAFAAVAQGSYQDPKLITLRYEPPGVEGPLLAYVGKAVTFDTGGISLKPGLKMSEMKFDMSGGAAVLAAVGAIAELALPMRVLAVIGATENMPSGRSVRPGDIVRASNGTTIEVINTDAEGRMVLADCLAHAVAEGADRLVDIATLTGAIVSALGATHAGVISDDDDWAAEVEAAGETTGELVWRLPLHPEYAELIKSSYADILNAVENRKAGSITAAEFLRRFTGGVPWAHLDIAGTAYGLGRAYAPKGAAGYGTRLLIELARRGAASNSDVK